MRMKSEFQSHQQNVAFQLDGHLKSFQIIWNHFKSFEILIIFSLSSSYRLERENCQQQQHPQLKPSNPLNSFTTIAASFNNSLGHGNNGSASGPLAIQHLNAGNNSNNNSINSGQQLQLDPLSLNSDSLNYEPNLSSVSNAGNSNLFGMNLQPSTSKINDTGDLHNNIMHKYALQPIMLQNSLTDEQNELMEFKKKGVYLFLFNSFILALSISSLSRQSKKIQTDNLKIVLTQKQTLSLCARIALLPRAVFSPPKLRFFPCPAIGRCTSSAPNDCASS